MDLLPLPAVSRARGTIGNAAVAAHLSTQHDRVLAAGLPECQRAATRRPIKPLTPRREHALVVAYHRWMARSRRAIRRSVTVVAVAGAAAVSARALARPGRA